MIVQYIINPQYRPYGIYVCSVYACRHTVYGLVWIGLNDIDVNMRFEWSDGTPYDYNNAWGAGQPDDVYRWEAFYYRGGADCVTMDIAGQWHDRACFRVFPAICQMGMYMYVGPMYVCRAYVI